MAEGDKPAKSAKAAKGEADASAPAKRSKADERSAKESAAKAAAAAAEDEDLDEADAREGAAQDEEEAPKAKGGKPKGGKGAKASAKGEDDEEAPAEKKVNLKPRPRPKVDGDLKRALELRTAKNADRQRFYRQEWFRYQRLGKKWRAPGGIQSKMRRHWGTHADVVSIGYRGPRAARGLHPSGFREVLIHNEQGLEDIDPAREAVRIAASVGRRKREQIQNDARKRGIRVLNWKVWRD